MTMSVPTVRRGVSLLAAATCVVALAGCGGDDVVPVVVPSPAVTSAAPEPSKTAPDPEQVREENIEAAQQVVVDYWAAVDKVGQTDDEDWWELEEFFSSDLWLSYRPQFEDNHDAGVRTDGAVRVATTTVTEYLPSEAGLERITLESCLDFSDRTAFDGEGAAIEPVAPDRYVTEYVLAHSGSGTVWRIDETTARTEESC
jgi:hypothetical protein